MFVELGESDCAAKRSLDTVVWGIAMGDEQHIQEPMYIFEALVPMRIHLLHAISNFMFYWVVRRAQL